MKTRTFGASLLLAIPALAVCGADSTAPRGLGSGGSDWPIASAATQGIPVSGSTVAFASTAVVLSEVPSDGGLIQRSTSVARLTGDLEGWLLFQPTSVFDFDDGTLVNTGTQIFAGTVLGSEPVVLHDDVFLFDNDLTTGTTTGDVHLSRSNDAPRRGGWFECHLEIVGTGVTPAGDPTSDYSGTCIQRGNFRS
jgi:hypothetical protein